MRIQYVIVDNGRDYSDNSVDIYRTSLDDEDILKLLDLWAKAFSYGSTTEGGWAMPRVVAFAYELFDVQGGLLESPSLKEDYGDMDKNDYHFIDRCDDVDGAQLQKDIEEILAKDTFITESK